MEDNTFKIKDLFFGRPKSSKIEFFRSLFVGGAASVADYFVLVLLKEVFGMDAVFASIFGFVFGVVVNYLMSNYWAFGESNIKDSKIRFLIFVAIAVVGMGINSAVVWYFDEPLAKSEIFKGMIAPRYYYIIGKIAATVIVFVWNFTSRKLLIYRGSKKIK